MDRKVLKNNAKLIDILEKKGPGYALIIDAEEKVRERHSPYFPSLLSFVQAIKGPPTHCLGTPVLPLKVQY